MKRIQTWKIIFLAWYLLWTWIFYVQILKPPLDGLTGKRDEARMFRPLSFRERLNEDRVASLKKLLDAYSKLLNEAGVRWWLDAGTLVGQWREGGFLKVLDSHRQWDTDVDVAFDVADLPKLQQIEQGRSWPKDFDFYLSRDPEVIMAHFVDRVSGHWIDTWRLEHNKTLDQWQTQWSPHALSNCRYGNSQTRLENNQRQWRLSYRTDEIFPLQPCSIDGLIVFCPHQPEDYLKHCYADPSQVPFKRAHPYVLPVFSFLGFVAGTGLLERFFKLTPGRVTSPVLGLLGVTGPHWPDRGRDE